MHHLHKEYTNYLWENFFKIQISNLLSTKPQQRGAYQQINIEKTIQPF